MRPGYKQTEVGVIPQQWETRHLRDLVDGLNPITYGVLKPGSYVPNGVPLLQIKDVIHGDIDAAQLHRIGPILDRQYFRTKLIGGEIVVSLVGTIGRIAHIPDSLAGGKLHRNLARIFVSGKYASKFIFYYLCSERTQAAIKLTTFGSTQSLLNLSDLRKLPIAIPPLPEQCAIAIALSDVDALLAKLDQLIAKKRDLKQAAMQQLLTGQTRLPGFVDQWEEVAIGDLCEMEMGEITAGGDEGYIEIGDIDVITKTYNIASKGKFSVPGAVRVPKGTLLISTVRPTRGAITITRDVACVSSAFCRLRVDNQYVFHIVCQEGFLSYLGEHSKGGTYPTCNDHDVLNFRTSVPCSREEQAAIATVLSDMDEDIAALEASSDKTRALKQGMMQELLTGKIRLV